MIHQPKLGDILAIDGIVTTLQRDTMIPDRSVSLYGLVQLTIAVIRIQFELVGVQGRLAFWLSYPVSKGVGDTTVRWRETLPRKPKEVYHFLPAKSTCFD